jgi:hypothetical protein
VSPVRSEVAGVVAGLADLHQHVHLRRTPEAQLAVAILATVAISLVFLGEADLTSGVAPIIDLCQY